MKKILVIDNEDETLEVYSILFPLFNMEIAMASSMQDGIEVLKDEKFHAAVIKIYEPDTITESNLDAIRNILHCEHLPIFVVTNVSIDNEKLQALKEKYQIVKSLHKPFVLSTLIDSIQHYWKEMGK